jgi:hypothetical protein
MATRMVKIDDFDGKSEGAETTFFSIDDVFYRLDLAPANKKKLTEALAPFIDKGEHCDAPKGGKRMPASTYDGYPAVEPDVIRAWAVKEGIEVGEKGRIPETLVTRYHQAMKADAAKK